MNLLTLEESYLNLSGITTLGGIGILYVCVFVCIYIYMYFLFFFISPEYSLLLVEQPVLTSSLHLSSMCAQGSVGGELSNCLILMKQ